MAQSVQFDDVSKLSPKEFVVARLIGEGLSNDEIAAHLWLSQREVEGLLTLIVGRVILMKRQGISDAETYSHVVDRHRTLMRAKLSRRPVEALTPRELEIIKTIIGKDQPLPKHTTEPST